MENSQPAMLTNNPGEQTLVTDCLTPDMRVLEFGLGESTLVLSSLVKSVLTIEHSQYWVDQFKGRLPDNVTVCFVPPDHDPSPEYDDGTYNDFKQYVHFPEMFLSDGKFDVVFIDGRARVACARLAAEKYLKKGGLIFIHDYRHPTPIYRRPEYEVVEEFLEMTGHHFAMAKFKVKE
jgi:hypothetical protein